MLSREIKEFTVAVKMISHCSEIKVISHCNDDITLEELAVNGS